MKRNVFEPFPKVERIVEFTEDDFRENRMVTIHAESSITEERWKEFADNALVLSNGQTIYQYAEEFPIVAYRCSEDAGVMPSSRLNTFIESIMVSTANFGKRFSLNKRDMEWEYTGLDTVAYFTDNIGRRTIIPCRDISRFLLKKPNLVISNEGLLVFFTEKAILATSDCEHYAWVHDIDTENGKIIGIEVYEDCCIVNLEDNENHDESGNSMKYSYKLQFIIDMVDHGMIKPEVTKN